MSDQQSGKADFEAYIKRTNPDDYDEDGEKIFTWIGGTYSWYWVRAKWEVWQASRACLCVTLPELESWHDDERHVAIAECRAAIESTGVKTK